REGMGAYPPRTVGDGAGAGRRCRAASAQRGPQTGGILYRDEFGGDGGLYDDHPGWIDRHTFPSIRGTSTREGRAPRGGARRGATCVGRARTSLWGRVCHDHRDGDRQGTDAPQLDEFDFTVLSAQHSGVYSRDCAIRELAWTGGGTIDLGAAL